MSAHSLTEPYASFDVKAATQHVRTFLELGRFAINQYQVWGFKELYALTGPITTGAYTKEENLARFKWAVAKFNLQGIDILDPGFWEPAISRLSEIWCSRQKGKYPVPLIDNFFGTTFRSGLVKGAFLMPGYGQSTGSRLEVSIYDRTGIPMTPLPRAFFQGMPRHGRL